jgi:hypothetical protein
MLRHIPLVKAKALLYNEFTRGYGNEKTKLQ